jgi:hypothetical protein
LQLLAWLGRWLQTALNMCYLRFFKPEGLLAAAGWDKDKLDAFFAEHFCLSEDVAALVAQLLPVELAQSIVRVLSCFLDDAVQQLLAASQQRLRLPCCA